MRNKRTIENFTGGVCLGQDRAEGIETKEIVQVIDHRYRNTKKTEGAFLVYTTNSCSFDNIVFEEILFQFQF